MCKVFHFALMRGALDDIKEDKEGPSCAKICAFFQTCMVTVAVVASWSVAAYLAQLALLAGPQTQHHFGIHDASHLGS